MTERVSVTEVRNALRCPRIFALGRSEGRAVSFPVGSSCLGSTFHRIVERFARSAYPAPPKLGALPEKAPTDATEAVLRVWLLDLLVEDLRAEPSLANMPAEVDDLAEALRQFASYLAGRLSSFSEPPAEALAKLITSGERQVEAPWPSGPYVRGRLDALFCDRDGNLEVIEYKLTDEANDDLDRAQVVLYRELLRLSGEGEPHATVLRFLPHLRESSLKDAAARGVADQILHPVLEQMPGWIADPDSAPATSRKDLCASCPMSEPCALRYPRHLSQRDDPPTAGMRPHATADGTAVELRGTASAKHHDDDRAGKEEAATLRDRILAELSKLGASASCNAPPVVGPRTYLIELTRKSGAVSALDRAAADVQHRLASELGVEITYEKEGGHRRFLMTRRDPRPVFLEPMLRAKQAFLSASSGRFVVGATPAGEVITGDFSDGSAAHLLVAGQTGSGKSVFIQALVASLVHYHGPEAIRFTLVDPKRVTFTSASFRASIAAHLEGPVCYDAEEVLPVVAHLVEQMEERYRLFEANQVSDLAEYNEACPDRPLERRVLIVDEFQDLLIDKEQSKVFLSGVQRLGAKARAAGIHLVLATQRPSKQAIPPIIKANLVGKVAFQVANAVDSRIVLDHGGAERLLGRGDLLVNLGRGTLRAQAALLSPR